ncbi:hypothetical protein ColKHC_07431 [Colletotrichum higginsianum]|nr:hypothetical protein ColKHC_07431 [Colletotrichum higginsianum]
MGIGTLLIVGAIVFLGSFWQTSIRAGDGEIVHPQLWSVVVFSDWASRVVTITAAVLRICLALQMGVFTAMMASLMIERAGVPLTSAPLISILRAVSVSPYNLITWTTFAMPWRDRLIYTFSIAVSVLLAVGFQFSSTVLLSDFNAVNVTTPNKVADVLLSGGNNVDTDRETLEGSKLWNSPPPTYFRFAEAREHPVTSSCPIAMKTRGTSCEHFSLSRLRQAVVVCGDTGAPRPFSTRGLSVLDPALLK